MYLEASLCCGVLQHTNHSVCETDTERMNIGGGFSDDNITATGCGQFTQENIQGMYMYMVSCVAVLLLLSEGL